MSERESFRYVIHFRIRKMRRREVEIALFIYSTLSMPPPMCTHIHQFFEGRKIFMFNFFRMLDIVSPDAFLSSTPLAVAGHTHSRTIFVFILYSFPSCKLGNYYDFVELASCRFIRLLKSSLRNEVVFFRFRR